MTLPVTAGRLLRSTGGAGPDGVLPRSAHGGARTVGALAWKVSLSYLAG